MKRISLALLALIISGAATARGVHTCGVVSAYDLRIEANALVFHRPTQTLEMRDGRLLADGEDVALDAADRRRVQ